MIECDCICHTQPDIVHVVACCTKCSFCGKNIRMVYIDSHEEECRKEHMKRTVLQEVKKGETDETE